MTTQSGGDPANREPGMSQNTNRSMPGGGPHVFVPPPRIDSSQLLRGHRLVEIQHDGQCYTLRVTRGNKLILTK